MLIPSFVTFTGADDRTDIAAMGNLAAQYPIEYGILFSRSREGDARYPTAGWMRGLEGAGLRLAAHICGYHASEIVETGQLSILDRLGPFDRIQINTAPLLETGIENVLAAGDRVSQRFGKPVAVILQVRQAFPEDSRVKWLFDASGGRGLVSASYPAPPVNPQVRIGYAGGLGPENVAAVLAGLPDVQESWIDMETRIRNDTDDFDLGLCRAVCEKIIFKV
ncbi:hypothetical protein ACEUZ9_000753 [Paracoccus litorisediminis]|uniref:hypothetical protein n=1 Tax=Paracoccus litorisediminis TaxID=2006130 RepID=UPI00372E72F2